MKKTMNDYAKLLNGFLQDFGYGDKVKFYFDELSCALSAKVRVKCSICVDHIELKKNTDEQLKKLVHCRLEDAHWEIQEFAKEQIEKLGEKKK